jgi:hypothetical protein
MKIPRGEIVVKDATIYWDNPDEPIDDTGHEGNTGLTLPSIFDDASSEIRKSDTQRRP